MYQSFQGADRRGSVVGVLEKKGIIGFSVVVLSPKLHLIMISEIKNIKIT